MLDWIKNINKEYPEFWKSYLAKFEKKPSRFVVLCTQTSGHNPAKDVIFSFGAIGVIDEQVIISDSFEVVLLQYIYLHDNGLSNEFLVESKLPKKTEIQAVEDFINYVGNAILVGYRIYYDVELINAALDKMGCGRLKNEALDIEIMFRKWKDADGHYTINEMCSTFKLPKVEQTTASEEAYIMALIFLKLKTRLGIS
ncbi:MAG: 3'-5' exonuclease [Flavobacterium sp.]|nr:MAG: 3'-5' exonuclease [Flavobacterium sp.]